MCPRLRLLGLCSPPARRFEPGMCRGRGLAEEHPDTGTSHAEAGSCQHEHERHAHAALHEQVRCERPVGATRL